MILGYLEAGFFEKILVTFLSLLNGMIYGLVSTLCGLFSELSNVVLFNDAVVQQFTRRIYVVLGIYMLFKLAISLLNSIINPDNLLDKEKGMQKIITRSVMALAMLVLVPSVFDIAIGYQDSIAKAVPKIIIGAGDVDNLEGQGEVLASTALKAFIIPNEQCSNAQSGLTSNNLDYLLTLPSELCVDDSRQFAYEFNGFVGLVAGIFTL